jgi:hypothetical protein
MSLRLIALLAASLPLFPSVGSAAAARDPCEAPPASMRQFGISYKDTLRQAYAHKERGLVVLFRLSISPELDGMWAECYASDIRKLLDVWGDKQFAAVLRKQPSRVQKAVSQTLREIAFAELSNRYPESFSVNHP